MTLQGTPDWLAERRQFVGASEVAAIVGSDPYRSEFELAQEKRGEGEARESWPMRWGNHVQRLGIAVYSELTGRPVRNVTTTARHPRWPHVRASIDGRVVGLPVGVEVKWTGRTVHEPLEHWLIQVQVQMTVVGLAAVDIIRLSGRDEPAIWTVEADPDLGTQLADMAEQWYLRYIEGDELPPLDGSRAARAWLDTLRGTETMTATEDQQRLAQQLRRIRADLKDWERADQQLVNDLKASMAGYGRLEGDDFRIDWVGTKGRRSTNWQGVAAAYRQKLVEWNRTLDPAYDGADLDTIESLHTGIEKPGSQFRPTWQDREEEEDSDDD